MGWGWEGRFRREGTCEYLQLIRVVWQKPSQHYKAVIFQFKIFKIFNATTGQDLSTHTSSTLSFYQRVLRLREGSDSGSFPG